LRRLCLEVENASTNSSVVCMSDRFPVQGLAAGARVRERQVDSLPEAASSHSCSDPRRPDLDAMLVQLPENQREVIVMLILKVLGMTLQGPSQNLFPDSR
jgi:hypothetical protein